MPQPAVEIDRAAPYAAALAAALLLAAAAEPELLRGALTRVGVDRDPRPPGPFLLAAARAGALALALLVGAAAVAVPARVRGRGGGSSSRRRAPGLRAQVAADASAWWTAWGRVDLAVVAALAALGLAARTALALEPVGYDEATTYVFFVSRSLLDVLTDYSIPNNHVLHNVLARAGVAVLGDHPLALRLPALAAGTLLIPATFWAGRRGVGRRAGLLAAALAAGAPALVELSAQARGYTLVALLAVAAFVAATYVDERPTRSGWSALVVLAALALWTVPAALYALAVPFAWLVAAAPRGERLRRLGGVAAAAAASVALAAFLYLPAIVVSGLDSLVGNRYVDPLAPGDFLRRNAHNARALLACWTGGAGVVGIAAFALGTAGVAWAALRGEGRAMRLLLALVLGTAPPIAAQRVAPPVRVLDVLFPFVALVVAAGLAWLWERTPLRGRRGAWTGVVLAAGVGWAASRAGLLEGVGGPAPPGRGLPPGAEGVRCCVEGFYADAAAVADDLAPVLGPGDVVVVHEFSGMASALRFELMRRGVHPAHVHPYRPHRGAAQLAPFRRVRLLAWSRPGDDPDAVRQVTGGPAAALAPAFAVDGPVTTYRVSRLVPLRRLEPPAPADGPVRGNLDYPQ